MIAVEYKCLGGGLTRVATRPDNAVPGGRKEYYVADGLGSTRLVVGTGGTVLERIEYDPYGRPRLGPPTAQQTYIGRPRDPESGLGDHGVRKYEPAEGRFHSVDPRWESFRSVSPYHYAHANPLNRVDANGQWDIIVHVSKDRSQNGYGIAVVTNRKGEEVFRFTVRVEGVGDRARYGSATNPRDRTQRGSDTPLGVYDIPAGRSKWRSDRPDIYGPHPRLVLNERYGEVMLGSRSAIRIHGGRQGEGAPRRSVEELKRTHGCLRVYDQTMKSLKEVTDALEAADPLENGGMLIIMDDLVVSDGVAVPTSDDKHTSR
jgi:RHS repeat-associated protein